MRKSAVVDEDLPRSLVPALREAGWEAKDVRDFGLRGSKDIVIARFAQKNKAVLFSGDWDFANILNFPPREYYGIAILHFPNEVSSRAVVQESINSLAKIPVGYFKGSLIVIQPGKIRVRRTGG